ncbi:hypothetical protein BJ742DRAFT_737985 [Cladochytrium replicatum]|nr:hypothetical protein BJ742DRAFT_737985 [Cladochytrium replicatum]
MSDDQTKRCLWQPDQTSYMTEVNNSPSELAVEQQLHDQQITLFADHCVGDVLIVYTLYEDDVHNQTHERQLSKDTCSLNTLSEQPSRGLGVYAATRSVSPTSLGSDNVGHRGLSMSLGNYANAMLDVKEQTAEPQIRTLPRRLSSGRQDVPPVLQRKACSAEVMSANDELTSIIGGLAH